MRHLYAWSREVMIGITARLAYTLLGAWFAKQTKWQSHSACTQHGRNAGLITGTLRRHFYAQSGEGMIGLTAQLAYTLLGAWLSWQTKRQRRSACIQHVRNAELIAETL